MTLYSELGVDRTASQEEIKKAYWAKSQDLHPDTGNKTEDFKRLSEIYGILKSPKKRAIYDKTGEEKSVNSPPLYNVAIERILMLIDQIISKVDNPFDHDLVEVMERNILENQKKLRSDIGKAKIVGKNLKGLKKRFTFKPQMKLIRDDIIVNMLDDKIRQANNQLENLKTQIKIADLMLKILKSYKFKANPSTANYPIYSFNSGTTSSASS